MEKQDQTQFPVVLQQMKKRKYLNILVIECVPRNVRNPNDIETQQKGQIKSHVFQQSYKSKKNMKCVLMTWRPTYMFLPLSGEESYAT